MNARMTRREAGLSLIELMIALVLGSILTVGLIQVFIASRSSYAVAEGLSRVQENARFALDAMQRDLRMVGHYGCVNDQFRLQRTDLMISHLATGGALDFTRSIQGFEATGSAPGNTVDLSAPGAGWSPALPAYISGLNPAPSPGSDVILVRFLSGEGVPVTEVGTGGNTSTFKADPAKWSVLTQGGVANPGIFGVADCTYADVFQASTAAPSTGTVTALASGLNTSATNFDTRYTASPAGQTVLYRGEALVYYVAPGAGGGPSLWRARFGAAPGGALTSTAEELVEGIENIQLIYGQDQSTDLTQLTGNVAVQNTAQTLGTTEAEWRRVGQVRIGVLARSPDPATSGASVVAPRLLGTSLAPPADSRYRASYESTVALRNRLYSNN